MAVTAVSFRTRIDTSGIDKLMAKKEQAVNALDKHAFAIEASAKVNAPVLTGALRNSINTKSPSRYLRVIQDGVLYGIYQELGTSRSVSVMGATITTGAVSARYFLTNAAENQAEKFFDELRSIFR